jgi:hypothetical protein
MNSDFKLCKKALDGLKLLNNELPSELSKRLLKNAVKQILIKNGTILWEFIAI